MYYAGGAMPKAVVFARRAAHNLPEGSMDWERANDILSAAGPQAQSRR